MNARFRIGNTYSVLGKSDYIDSLQGNLRYIGYFSKGYAFRYYNKDSGSTAITLVPRKVLKNREIIMNDEWHQYNKKYRGLCDEN